MVYPVLAVSGDPRRAPMLRLPEVRRTTGRTRRNQKGTQGMSILLWVVIGCVVFLALVVIWSIVTYEPDAVDSAETEPESTPIREVRVDDYPKPRFRRGDVCTFSGVLEYYGSTDLRGSEVIVTDVSNKWAYSSWEYRVKCKINDHGSVRWHNFKAPECFLSRTGGNIND